MAPETSWNIQKHRDFSHFPQISSHIDAFFLAAPVATQHLCQWHSFASVNTNQLSRSGSSLWQPRRMHLTADRQKNATNACASWCHHDVKNIQQWLTSHWTLLVFRTHFEILGSIPAKSLVAKRPLPASGIFEGSTSSPPSSPRLGQQSQTVSGPLCSLARLTMAG